MIFSHVWHDIYFLLFPHCPFSPPFLLFSGPPMQCSILLLSWHIKKESRKQQLLQPQSRYELDICTLLSFLNAHKGCELEILSSLDKYPPGVLRVPYWEVLWTFRISGEVPFTGNGMPSLPLPSLLFLGYCGESFTLPCTMHSQPSCQLPCLKPKTRISKQGSKLILLSLCFNCLSYITMIMES